MGTFVMVSFAEPEPVHSIAQHNIDQALSARSAIFAIIESDSMAEECTRLRRALLLTQHLE
jgi:hypothetical protein